jgi:ankyrin repeat protein
MPPSVKNTNMQTDVHNAPPAAELDDNTIEFANAVLDLARSGDSGPLSALLGNGLSPNLRNHRGDSLLMLAAFKGDLPMIKLLLAYGADIEGASPDGRTALMIAAMFDRTGMVEYLVSRGANLDATDATGVSAADAAQRMGASKALALLQEMKLASVDLR